MLIITLLTCLLMPLWKVPGWILILLEKTSRWICILIRIVTPSFGRQWNSDQLLLFDDSNVLGEGTYGRVWLCLNVQTNEDVAVKLVSVTDRTKKFVERELTLLLKCDHANIIKLLWSTGNDDYRFFVMEYCSHGNLNTFIEYREISFGLCVKFMLNIAQAVDYLHKKRISHRDIKPANILVSEDDGYFLKLADFGLARYFPGSSTGIAASMNTGTQGWMAPEVHDGCDLESRYNISADVFSLGLVFLALVLHQLGKCLEPFRVNGYFLGPWMRVQHSNGREVPVPAIGNMADKRMVLIHHMLAFRPYQRYRMPVVCKKLQELPRDEERVTRCDSTQIPRPRVATRERTRCRTVRALCALSVVFLLLLLGIGIYLSTGKGWDERCEDMCCRLDINALEKTLQKDLYGQHLAIETIVQSFRVRMKHPRPDRALVLSMHGPRGVGKSFASRMIAEHLYDEGIDSPFVHVINTETTYVGLRTKVRYQPEEIIRWVQEKVNVCPYSLFIFDKAEHLPPSLLTDLRDSLKSDFKESVFLFESSTCSDGIINETGDHYKKGQNRNDITLKSMRQVIRATKETNHDWSHWHTELLSANIVSAFVPFLPLERKHLVKCIANSVAKYVGVTEPGEVRSSLAELVAQEYKFFNIMTTQFSTFGCERVDEHSLRNRQQISLVE